MREFLSGLFEVSLTMGAVTALLLILSPVWKRRFRPQWRCWAWLLVALRLAVPFNVSLPRAPVVLEAPAPAAVARINDRYRYRLTLAAQNTKEIRAMVAHLVRCAQTDKENKGVSVSADVNPLD